MQGGWTSQSLYPRLLGDVNGDGKADVVGCKDAGVVVGLSTGSSFTAPVTWTTEFCYNVGWTSFDTYPRALADMNGDGMDDLVGFKDAGTWVALSTGRSFAPATLWYDHYSGQAGGWSSYNINPRALGNVDGVCGADIVGFGNQATYVTRYDHQARMYYDADGNRVMSVVDGARAVYIGDWVETGAAYYHLGGQRVARRAAGGVTYLHGDHLGSVGKTSGYTATAQLYDAYGAKRGASEVDAPYRYTGQRWEENDALDIYYYKARWYDPQLGRFLQPDPFVPEPGNPQALNRYSYTLNNPMRYIDPTGFVFESEAKAAQDILDQLAKYGVSVNKDWGYRWVEEGAAQWFEGSWQYEELGAVRNAVEALANRLGAESGTSATDAFRRHIGAVYFERHKTPDLSYRWTVVFAGTPAAVYVVGAGKIKVYNEAFTGKLAEWDAPFPEGILVHELGHAWDAKPGVWGSELIRSYVGKERPPTKDARKGNASEHWAETVYAWTYPDRPDVQVWSGHPGLGPWHTAFMSFAVQGFRMSGENQP